MSSARIAPDQAAEMRTPVRVRPSRRRPIPGKITEVSRDRRTQAARNLSDCETFSRRIAGARASRATASCWHWVQ